MRTVENSPNEYKAFKAVTDIFIGLMLSAFILICSPYETIMGFKYWLFIGLCGTYVFCLLFLGVNLLLVGNIKASNLAELFKDYRHIILGSVCFLFTTSLSAFLSPYKYDFLRGGTRDEGLFSLLIYVAILLGTTFFGSLKPWHHLVFHTSMLLFCLLCFIQFTGRNPLRLFPAGYSYLDAGIAYSGAYLGTIGNSDLISALLSMSIAFAYVDCLDAKRGKRILPLTCLCSCFAVLLFSGVAAGLLASIVMFAVITPIWLYVRKKPYFKVCVISEVVVIIDIFAVIYFVDIEDVITLSEFHNVMHGNIDPSYGSSRLKIWTEVLVEVKKHPLFGTGPDSMFFWNLEGFSKYVESIDETVYRGIDVAHNEFLNVFAQSGIIPGLCWIALPFFSARRFFLSREKEYKLLVLAPCLSYVVQSFFCFSACYVTPIYLLFTGILMNKRSYDK